MKRPSLHLLSEYAPRSAWERAYREAERSPLRRFGTGAVLLDRKGRTLATGCSHVREDQTVSATCHAEVHALRRAPNDLRHSSIILVTVSQKGGGCAHSSQPCQACARILVRRGVEKAVYPVRTSRGWKVVEDDLTHTCETLSPARNKNHLFARHLRRAPVS